MTISGKCARLSSTSKRYNEVYFLFLVAEMSENNWPIRTAQVNYLSAKYSQKSQIQLETDFLFIQISESSVTKLLMYVASPDFIKHVPYFHPRFCSMSNQDGKQPPESVCECVSV